MTDPIKRPTAINLEAPSPTGMTPEQFKAMEAGELPHLNSFNNNNNKFNFGSAGVSMGMAGLNAIPNIVAANDVTKGLTTNQQARDAVKAKTISNLSTGASLGGTIGGTIGTAILPGVATGIVGAAGAVIGAGIGAISGQVGANKLINKVGKERSDALEEQYAEKEKQDLRDYYKNNSSEKMEATLKLLKEQQGLFDT